MKRFLISGLAVVLCASGVFAEEGEQPAMHEADATEAFRVSDHIEIDDTLGVDFRGWIQQGFTYNSHNPQSRSNVLTAFNDRSSEYQLNQLYALIEKQVHREGGTFDIGGRLDLMFGTDSRFIERRGIELHGDGTKNWNDEDRRFYDFSAPQFYIDMLLPAGDGLLVRIGRFYTLHMSNESFMAPDNDFYSHSYSYITGLAVRDHTGILLSYPLTDQLTLSGGYTTAPVAFSPGQHNGHGGVVALGWISADQNTTIDLVSSSERFYTASSEFDELALTGRAWVTTLVVQHNVTDQLRVVLTGLYAYGSDIEMTLLGSHFHAEWYSASVALIYQISPTISAGARFDWFCDHDNTAIYGLSLGRPEDLTNYYAFTAALNWQVHPNIKIRPEVRVDWVDDGLFSSPGPFDDFHDDMQFTASVDAIITF